MFEIVFKQVIVLNLHNNDNVFVVKDLKVNYLSIKVKNNDIAEVDIQVDFIY